MRNHEMFDRGRRFLAKVTEELGWLPPLLARVTLGLVFIGSGWGKLNHLEKVTGFFGNLGIPFPAQTAAFVGGVELVCGVLVLIGLAARVMSIPLICTMIVAIITAKREEIASVSDFVGLVEWAYLVMLAWIVINGPGVVSIDHLIANRAQPHTRDQMTRLAPRNAR